MLLGLNFCSENPAGSQTFDSWRLCRGTMDHGDPGGPLYEHKTRECTLCGEPECDFTDAACLGPGWY